MAEALLDIVGGHGVSVHGYYGYGCSEHLPKKLAQRKRYI
jgi:hypothetical protein